MGFFILLLAKLKSCIKAPITLKFRRFLTLGSRPTAGHQTLDLSIGVRIPASQREFTNGAFV